MRLTQKLARWLSSWDVADWLAAALCVAPFAVMILGNPTAGDPESYSPPVWETLVSLLILPIGIIVLLPFVAAPQFVNFWLVRRTGLFMTKLLLLLVSAAMLIPYHRFVSTADLISTSTAPLDAAFYPIHLAMFSVPISLAVWWISKVVERRRRPIP